MRKVFLATALSALLAGCGGGGDESRVISAGVASGGIMKAGVAPSGGTLVAQPISRSDAPADFRNFSSISPLPDGGYVVVRTAESAGPARFNIQRHDGSGNKTEEVDLADPAFAADSTLTVMPNGDLLVSYVAMRPFGPQSERAALTKSAVYLQRFNRYGARREEEFEIIANVQSLRDARSYNLFLDARVTALSDGGFVLGWDDRLLSVLGDRSTFYTQRFDRHLNRVGDSVKIDGTRPAYRMQSDPAGGYLLVRSVAAADAGSDCAASTSSEARDIAVVRYDQNQAATPIAGPARCIGLLPLAENKIVLFGSANEGAYSQLLDREGKPIGGPIPIAARMDFKAPGLTPFTGQIVLADGSYVLFWRPDADSIGGQRYSADGSAIGGQLAIDARDAGVGHQFVPLAVGGFVVAWSDFTQVFAEAAQ